VLIIDQFLDTLYLDIFKRVKDKLNSSTASDAAVLLRNLENAFDSMLKTLRGAQSLSETAVDSYRGTSFDGRSSRASTQSLRSSVNDLVNWGGTSSPSPVAWGSSTDAGSQSQEHDVLSGCAARSDPPSRCSRPLRRNDKPHYEYVTNCLHVLQNILPLGREKEMNIAMPFHQGLNAWYELAIMDAHYSMRALYDLYTYRIHWTNN